jgi:hypothetical protein
VKAADPASLADFLQRRILSIKGVTRMQAQISLSSKKESTLLPLMPERNEKSDKLEKNDKNEKTEKEPKP